MIGITITAANILNNVSKFNYSSQTYDKYISRLFGSILGRYFDLCYTNFYVFMNRKCSQTIFTLVLNPILEVVVVAIGFGFVCFLILFNFMCL